MTLPVLFFLLASALVAVFLQSKKIGIFLLFLGISWLFLVGGGWAPRLILGACPIYDRAENTTWKGDSVIVLLGGGTIRWQGSGQASSSTWVYSRIFEAVRLYRSCKRHTPRQCHILTSGGGPAWMPISEAEVMRQELVELGVDEQDIWVEGKSQNTQQNAKNSAAILKSKKIDQVFLVTSGVHMKRAILIFKNAGLHPIPAPADQARVIISWIPLSYNFFISDLIFREYVGRLYFSWILSSD